MANPIDIQTYLKGVEYPATVQALVEKAQQNGATEDVIEMLGSLPDDEYQTPADVQAALKSTNETDDDDANIPES